MALRDLHRKGEERYSLDDYVAWKQMAGASFPLGATTVQIGTSGKVAERSDNLIENYKTNSTVFACMGLRQSVFAEITFRFAGTRDGQIADFFGGPGLDLLQHPWPNGTTGELATRMIQDADLAGNFYAVYRNDRLYRRDPRRMSIILTGNPLEDELVDVAGYLYQPLNGGRSFTYLPDEVCHWSPIPDPDAEYRGMSWLTPVIREIQSDASAMAHRTNFYDNGATPNMVVKFPENVMSPDEFERFKQKMNQEYTGRGNAYKTLYLAPGADATVVGTKLNELAFDETQGRDEVRIAAAAGVPATLVGLKDSLKGSSLNAGNYTAARRRFADGTMRPLYRSAAAALETLVPAPNSNARLFYDDSKVAFFSDDRTDAATIQEKKATAILTLVNAGYEPMTVVSAVEQENPNLLTHTGLYSVQLQPPGNGEIPAGGSQ